MPILAGATTDESPVVTDDLALELKTWYPTLSEKDIKNFNKIYKIDDFGGDEHKRVRAAVGEPFSRFLARRRRLSPRPLRGVQRFERTTEIFILVTNR